MIISFEGLSKTVRGYISLGTAKVFTTVIFPINVSFLWFHLFRQLLKSLSFGIRLFSSNLDFSLENTIPNVFADSEVHSNFKFFNLLAYLNEPSFKIMVLLTFNRKPDINLKLSSIYINFFKRFQRCLGVSFLCC